MIISTRLVDRITTSSSRLTKSIFRSIWSSVCLTLVIATFNTSVAQEIPEKVTYDDHIKPIFREHCLSCHNANDKKSGLALDSFAATMAGGSGGECLVAADLDSSRLWALTAHIEQPTMPPNQDKIADLKLALLRKWIEQGMPENSGSTIKKPKVNLAAMGTVSQARPEGAPPMPETMLKQTPLFTERPAAIAAMAASPWSPLVAVGGQSQVSLYHTETGSLVGVLPFPEGEPQSITFSRDGRLVLVGGGRHSQSGYAVLYDIKSGNRIARVGDELDIVLAADLSDDNSKIALAGPQRIVRIYDTATGLVLHEMKRHTDWVYAVRFSPDGLLLATADRSNGMFIWETDTGRFYLDLIGHKNEIRTITWRPDSSALISGSLDGTIKMWEVVDGKPIKSWDAHGGGVSAVAICNDGTLVSTGKDNQVKVWDAAGNAAGSMPALVEHGLEVAITVDSKQIIAGDWAGNVRLWERANPANEKSLRPNPATLDVTLAATDAALKQSQAAFDQDKIEWDAVVAQQTAAQQTVTVLEAEVVVYNQMIEVNTKQLAEGKVVADQSTALVVQITQAIAADQAIVQQKTEAIAAGQAAGADVTAIQPEIDAIQAKIVEQQTLFATTQLQLTTQNENLTKLNQQALDLVAQRDPKQVMLEQSRVALQAMTEPMVASKAKFDAVSGRLAAAQAALTQAQSDVAQYQASVAQWGQKKAEFQAALDQLTPQKVAVRAEVDTKQGVRDSIVTKIAGLQNQIQELQKLISTEDQQKAAIEAEWNVQKSSLEKIQLQMDQLTTDLQSVQELSAAYK